MGKQLKGEKYIYLLMAYKLLENSGKDNVNIGEDSGMIGGQNFWRRFNLQQYEGKTLLIETKTSKNSANYSRTFEILYFDENTPLIREYLNKQGENCSTRWEH